MTEQEDSGLHELSYELGRNSKGLEEFKQTLRTTLQRRRPPARGNMTMPKANTDAIAAQSKALEKFAKRVEMMSPGGSVLSRKQVAVLAVVGTGIMVVVGWMVEAAVKWAVGWFIGTILKLKLGG
jgi:hypothetical protein